MMKRLCVAAAVSVALANPVWADSTDLGQLAPSQIGFGSIPNLESLFSDNFTFEVLSGSSVSFDFVGFVDDTQGTLPEVLFNVVEASNPSFSLASWSSSINTNFGQNEDWTVSSSTYMDLGIYTIFVSGPDWDGQSTGGYNLTITAAVPEPETYAMLLAGLGLLGVVARRRKQRQG